MARVIRTERAAFTGLPARAAEPLLSVAANGDVRKGALVAADIPAEFTRRNVPESISQSWTWTGSGTVIRFSGGGLSVPATNGPGTRIVYDASDTGVAFWDYSVGRDVGQVLWHSVPAGGVYQWTCGGVSRLRLASNGTLQVENGSGLLQLHNSTSSVGGMVEATNGPLHLHASEGAVWFQSGSGSLYPTLNYRENLGTPNLKYLTLHAAELWVQSLVAQNVLATIGGRVLVGPTSTLTRDLAPADTTIYVKHNAFQLYVVGVEYGSKLVLEAAGKFEVLTVLSTTIPNITGQGDYPYSVSRNVDGTGANQWYAGDAVFDSGKQTGAGGAFIDLLSQRGLAPGSSFGPTIVGNVRIDQSAVGWRERWAIGNLNGVFGNSTNLFGAAFGDPTSTRLQIDATNGIRMVNAAGYVTSHWTMAGDVTIGPTNSAHLLLNPSGDGSLRLRAGTVDKIVLQPSGDALLWGGLTVGADGTTGDPIDSATVKYIRSSHAQSWNNGRGFYFHYNPSTEMTAALIGNAATNRLQWDGTNLLVKTGNVEINPTVGIRLAGAPAGSGGWAPEYGFNITPAAFGGHAGIWGYEVWPERAVVIDNYAPGGGGTQAIVIQGQVTGSAAFSCRFRSLFGDGDPGVFPPSTSVAQFQMNYASFNVTGFGIGFYGQAVAMLQLGANSAVKPTSEFWQIASDRRMKRKITPVDGSDALALVRRVRIHRFEYTGEFDSQAGARGIGIVADEMAELLPESVTAIGPRQMQTWDGHELLMLSFVAVQALADRLEALEAKGSGS